MSDLVKYRLKCTTDDAHEFVWVESTDPVPTTCPANTAHTVDSNQTIIVDHKYDNEVLSKAIPAKGGPSLIIFGHKFSATPNGLKTSYLNIDFDCQIRFATLDADLKRGNKLDVYLQAEVATDVWVDVWQYLRAYHTTGDQVQEFTNEALTANNLNGFRFKIEYTDYTNSGHDVIVNAWGAFGG